LRDPRIRRASELPALDRCPDCKGTVYEKPLGAEASFARRECGSCGKRLGHVPADPRRALEWALNLRLKSGGFRGRSLGELRGTRAGLELLRWATEGAGPDLRRASRIVLDDLAGRQ
jgi:hypothetical protein